MDSGLRRNDGQVTDTLPAKPCDGHPAWFC